MKWLLAIALMATMLPAPHLNYQLVANGEDSPWCEVRADGRVEVMAIAYFDADDPDNPGLPFILDSGVFVIEDDEAAVFVEAAPVAMRVYARSAGSDGQFRAMAGCGSVPPRDSSAPARDTDPLEQCVVEFTETTEFYVWSYYLRPDSKNPGERLRHRTATMVQAEAEIITLKPRAPVAVQWFHRRCGLFIDWLGDEGWNLAATCGEIPS